MDKNLFTDGEYHQINTEMHDDGLIYMRTKAKCPPNDTSKKNSTYHQN